MLFCHNVAMLYTCTLLADVVGSSVKPAGSGKARALSSTPSASSDQADSPLVPLSPYLVQRPSDLSEALAGADPESEEGGDWGLKVGKLLPGQKVQMGWYKVPRSSFDYAPATLDSVLVDRGVKETDERKISTSTLIRFEQDSRTMSLVASFMDMTGAAAGRINAEAMEEESSSQRGNDA